MLSIKTVPTEIGQHRQILYQGLQRQPASIHDAYTYDYDIDQEDESSMTSHLKDIAPHSKTNPTGFSQQQQKTLRS